MTLHKLAAGSGYTYLTRQVAAHDRAERSQVGLAAYYEEKGESPGRWLGSGIAGLDLADDDAVTEEQMKLLFGVGRHPRSEEPDAIIAEILGGTEKARAEVRVEPDRRAAIGVALAMAGPSDTVLIAGKGHEQGQEFEEGRKIPFDDRDVARDELRKLVAGAPG